MLWINIDLLKLHRYLAPKKDLYFIVCKVGDAHCPKIYKVAFGADRTSYLKYGALRELPKRPKREHYIWDATRIKVSTKFKQEEMRSHLSLGGKDKEREFLKEVVLQCNSNSNDWMTKHNDQFFVNDIQRSPESNRCNFIENGRVNILIISCLSLSKIAKSFSAKNNEKKSLWVTCWSSAPTSIRASWGKSLEIISDEIGSEQLHILGTWMRSDMWKMWDWVVALFCWSDRGRWGRPRRWVTEDL